MKKIKINGTLIILLVFFSKIACGQVEQKLPNAIPPSPNAASLGKYGEIPVSLYTGLPNISISILNSNIKQFDFSINLSYHASGLKVEEYASSYGTGWTLNAGGVISVSFRGVDDKDYNGYLNNDGQYAKLIQKYLKNEMSWAEKQEFLLQCSKGQIDTEPDLFTFNFCGHSGKFTFDSNGKLFATPYNDYKIEHTAENNFIITDLNGNKYFFDEKELTTSTAFSIKNGASFNPLDPKQYVSSWYLSKIILKSGEEISYTYITNTITPKYQGSEARYFLYPYTQAYMGGNPVFETEYSIFNKTETYIYQKKIQSINLPDGKINFNYSSTARLDLPGDYPLDNITIYSMASGNYAKINKYDFLYTTGGGNRLFLQKITEEGNDPLANGKTHIFSYRNISSLPPTDSKSIDYWGYYNAANNSNTLVPKDYDTFPNFISGANREVNPSALQDGTIEKIIYPTKGYTTFDFEPHTYGSISGYPDFVDSTYSEIDQTLTVSMTPSSSNTSQFTLSYPQMVTFNSTMQGWETYIKIDKIDGTIASPYSHYGPGTNEQQERSNTVMLPAGTYVITGSNYESDWLCRITVFFKERQLTGTNKSRYAGGLRVKAIKNYGSDGALQGEKKFIYNLSSDSNRSSGVLVSKFYKEYNKNQVITVSNGSQNGMMEVSCSYLVRLSYSSLPLALTQGSHIGYREVRVYDGESSQINGMSVSKFISPKEIGDIVFENYPFGIGMSNDYARGHLIEKTDYKLVGNNLSKVRSVNNVYTLEGDALQGVPGLVIGYDQEHILNPSTSTFLVRDYLLQSIRSNLVETTDTVFTEGNKTTVKKQKFYFESPRHNLITRSSSYQSDGSITSVRTSYPLDYSEGNPFIASLVNAHNISAPIETVVSTEKDGQNYILKGAIYEYNIDSKGTIKNIFSLDAANKIDLSTFKFSNSQFGILPNYTFYDNFLKDNRYYLKNKIMLYNEFSNPLEIYQDKGEANSYIYSYKGQYPIAEIKNAEYNTVENLLGGSIAVNVFSNSNPTDAQVNAFLAPLRNGLPNAMVTTYTYKPLVGITSMTDAKGMTTTYEYDAFQRLKNIKDQNSNILKQTDYHYKN